MDEVRRYALCSSSSSSSNEDTDIKMTISPYGGHVLYDDYKELLDKYTTVVRQIKDLWISV